MKAGAEVSRSTREGHAKLGVSVDVGFHEHRLFSAVLRRLTKLKAQRSFMMGRSEMFPSSVCAARNPNLIRLAVTLEIDLGASQVRMCTQFPKPVQALAGEEERKQALVIVERIQRPEIDLAAILEGSSGAPQITAKRRGRPAKAVVEVEEKATKAKKSARKAGVMSEEGRQRIIEAQKKRWAVKRKG